MFPSIPLVPAGKIVQGVNSDTLTDEDVDFSSTDCIIQYTINKLYVLNELSYKALSSGLVKGSQSSPHLEDSPPTTGFCTLHVDVFAMR